MLKARCKVLIRPRVLLVTTAARLAGSVTSAEIAALLLLSRRAASVERFPRERTFAAVCQK